jgi:hypothetical protein
MGTFQKRPESTNGEVNMNKMHVLYPDESEKVLQAVIDKRVPVILSYLSKNKWHVAKARLTHIVDDKLYIEGFHSDCSPHPINIYINQPVGISFKYAYGKFVFDTTVVGLEPSDEPTNGGTLVLAIPDRIGVLQRRSYFRVKVPYCLKVNVVLWHRKDKHQETDQIHHYYRGRLADISAGGAQVVMPKQRNLSDDSQDFSAEDTNDETCPTTVKKPDFKKGQFITVRFTPMPYETPLIFNAQIRNILPTADNNYLCLGLQIVGLEASTEGRQVLSRIAGIVERYHQITQSSATCPTTVKKQQDMQKLL